MVFTPPHFSSDYKTGPLSSWGHGTLASVCLSASQASYSNKPLLVSSLAETGRPRVLRAPKMPSAFRHDPRPALLHTGSQGNLLECESGRAAFRRGPSQGAGLPRHGLQAPGLASPQPPAGPAVTGAGPCSARPGGLHTSAGASSGPQSLRHSLSGPWGKIPATPPWRGHPAWHTTGTCGTRGEQTGTQPSVTGPRAGPRGAHPTMGAKGLWSPSRQGWGAPGEQQGRVTQQPDPGREACSAVWPPGRGADAGMDTAGPAELGRPPSSKSSARPSHSPPLCVPSRVKFRTQHGGGSGGLASAHSACSTLGSRKMGLDLTWGSVPGITSHFSSKNQGFTPPSQEA